MGILLSFVFFSFVHPFWVVYQKVGFLLVGAVLWGVGFTLCHVVQSKSILYILVC